MCFKSTGSSLECLWLFLKHPEWFMVYVADKIINILYLVILFSWCTCKLAGASHRCCLSSLWDVPLP